MVTRTTHTKTDIEYLLTLLLVEFVTEMLRGDEYFIAQTISYKVCDIYYFY